MSNHKTFRAIGRQDVCSLEKDILRTAGKILYRGVRLQEIVMFYRKIEIVLLLLDDERRPFPKPLFPACCRKLTFGAPFCAW